MKSKLWLFTVVLLSFNVAQSCDKNEEDTDSESQNTELVSVIPPGTTYLEHIATFDLTNGPGYYGRGDVNMLNASNGLLPVQGQYYHQNLPNGPMMGRELIVDLNNENEYREINAEGSNFSWPRVHGFNHRNGKPTFYSSLYWEYTAHVFNDDFTEVTDEELSTFWEYKPPKGSAFINDFITFDDETGMHSRLDLRTGWYYREVGDKFYPGLFAQEGGPEVDSALLVADDYCDPEFRHNRYLANSFVIDGVWHYIVFHKPATSVPELNDWTMYMYRSTRETMELSYETDRWDPEGKFMQAELIALQSFPDYPVPALQSSETAKLFIGEDEAGDIMVVTRDENTLYFFKYLVQEQKFEALSQGISDLTHQFTMVNKGFDGNGNFYYSGRVVDEWLYMVGRVNPYTGESKVLVADGTVSEDPGLQLVGSHLSGDDLYVALAYTTEVNLHEDVAQTAKSHIISIGKYIGD